MVDFGLNSIFGRGQNDRTQRQARIIDEDPNNIIEARVIKDSDKSFKETLNDKYNWVSFDANPDYSSSDSFSSPGTTQTPEMVQARINVAQQMIKGNQLQAPPPFMKADLGDRHSGIGSLSSNTGKVPPPQMNSIASA
ncbi:MAG: hypothetical protein MK033_02210 [Candidatus Caenarcaniphilales bacterium]|nr:hypothetical protein [Candidatus Caenarcaniphilales bacterium]